MIQLDFFEELTETSALKMEIEELKQRSENVRKGLFARHNELAKLFVELKEEVDKLKWRTK